MRRCCWTHASASDRDMIDELRADQRVAFLDEHEAPGERSCAGCGQSPMTLCSQRAFGGPTTRGGEPSSPCSGRGDSARSASTATAT